MSICEGINT